MTKRPLRTRVARQMAELMTFAPIVIAQRVSRLTPPTSLSPSAAHREINGMVQEKTRAYAQSMTAMAMAATRHQFTLGALMMRPWFVPGAAPSARRWESLVQEAVVDVTASGMAPVVRKAKANARRLTRKPR